MKLYSWISLALLCFNPLVIADTQRANRLYSQQYYADALDEYLIDAKAGNAEAQAKLGLMYFWGRGILRDEAKSFKWSMASAKQGNPDAQHMLGYLYENGLAIPRNIHNAIAWYQKAANQGNAAAASSLANIYIHGMGVPIDTDKGFELATFAVKKNNRQGQYLLGLVYRNTFHDLELAKIWLKKAVQQGSAAAANELGLIFFEGRQQNTNLSQALFWFIIAEEFNSVEASQHRLTIESRMSRENVLQVQADARNWLEKILSTDVFRS